MVTMVKECLHRTLCSGWVVLFTVGLVYIVRGIFYIPALVRESDRIPTVEHYAPLWVWATVWIFAGVVLVAMAWYRKNMPLLIGVAGGMSAAWAVLYIGAWAVGASAAGYVTATSYVLILFLIVAYFALLYAVSRGGDEGSTPEVSQ